MPEILTQAEIDDLLNALKSGTAEEGPEESDEERPQVRAYDFRTANRFTKDQMRSLNMVFQSYTQLFANQVTSILRVACECEVLSVEELGYNEFNNSLPSPVILGVFTAKPMAGSQMIEVSPEVAYMLINRLLGGVRGSKESSKQFTEIELALIERFLRKIMHTYDEAWEKVLSVRTRLERLETNAQFVQIANPNDAVAVATLSVKIGGDEGLFSMCIPRSSIETVAAHLNTRTLYASSGTAGVHERDEQAYQAMSGRLEHAAVDLVAYFGETPATVADIVNLQVGDVIRLSHRVSEPVLMKIQHIPKFQGRIGTSGSHYAVRITDIIEEGTEDEPVTG